MTSQVFVDTSALYAVLDPDDHRHTAAAAIWHRLLDQSVAGTHRGFTHHGVVIETTALVQRRLGMEAVRALHRKLLPALDVVWPDADLHTSAVTALLAADQRAVSLVDWLSFEVMHTRNCTDAFAFDEDFAKQGFNAYDG